MRSESIDIEISFDSVLDYLIVKLPKCRCVNAMLADFPPNLRVQGHVGLDSCSMTTFTPLKEELHVAH
jgi:hypothetical protein